MIDAFLILGALSLLIGVSVWLLFRADEQMVAASAPSKVENTHPENKIYVYPTTGIGLADKSTSVFKREQPPLVAPPVDPPPPVVRVRFTSAKGRRLGEALLMPSARRPCVKHRTSEGLSVFQCSHKDADGTWVYRRTGVERE